MDSGISGKTAWFLFWTAENADIRKTHKNPSILRFVLQMNISPSEAGNRLKTGKNAVRIVPGLNNALTHHFSSGERAFISRKKRILKNVDFWHTFCILLIHFVNRRNR